MRKRIGALLLAGILFFTSGAEGVSAAQAPEDEITRAEALLNSEKSVNTADLDMQGKEGGLIQPVSMLVDASEAKNVYKYTAKPKGSAPYNGAYDKYSTNYYYNQLNDNQRALWDGLDKMCYDYLTGTQSLGPAKTYDDGGIRFDYCTTDFVMYNNMSFDEASWVAAMFRYSNPQYYFLQLLTPGYINDTDTMGKLALTLFDDFGDGGARKTATGEMFTKVNNWMSQINAQPNDLLKEKVAHDLICKNVKYDQGYEDPSITANEFNQSAYSTFVKGVTVCAGYSQAMQLLMNGAGIDCGVVTSLEHEWNIIKLNHTWYYVDCTWDDTDDETYPVIYNFFNRSKAVFTSCEGGIHHVAETFWNPYLPELTYDSGASGISNYGSIHTATTQLAAPVITISNNMVNITSPSGGNIYYAIGTQPSDAFFKATRYTAPFSVAPGTAVRAVAMASGYVDSPVTEALIRQATVTLNANGGQFSSRSEKKRKLSFCYVAGSTYDMLVTPKRKGGYTFLGWYTKKSGGREITSATQITENSITLYAHWSKIKPKSVSISKLKSKQPGEMTVTIKNVKSASGYQIKYSKKKNMKSAKTRTVIGNKNTITGLKGKKTYYVQARMYQTDSVSGKKKYGPWSSVKSVKIKK